MRKTPLRRSSHPGATARRRRGLTIAVPPVMVPAGMALPGAEVQMAPTGAARAIAAPKGVGNLVVVLKGADQARQTVGLMDLLPAVRADRVDLKAVRDGVLDQADLTGDRAAALALAEADRDVVQEWGDPVVRGT